MAAAAGGVTDDTLRAWEKRDPDFAQALSVAQELGYRIVVEAELYDRAFDREDRASGRLLELVVKARDSAYREKSQVSMEITHRAEAAMDSAIEGYASPPKLDTT